MDENTSSIFQTTTGIISAVGSLLVILSFPIGLYLRYRKKLKFKKCKITAKKGMIQGISFLIKNRSLQRTILISMIGYKTQKDGKEYQFYPTLYYHKEILPKNEITILCHSKGEPSMSEHLKSKISYLVIKHNAGGDYKYRCIRFLKRELKKSGFIS